LCVSTAARVGPKSLPDLEWLVRHARIAPSHSDDGGEADADADESPREHRVAPMVQPALEQVRMAVANNDPGLIHSALMKMREMGKVLEAAALLPTPQAMLAILERWPELLNDAFDAEASHGRHLEFWTMFQGAVPITAYLHALRNGDAALIAAVTAQMEVPQRQKWPETGRTDKTFPPPSGVPPSGDHRLGLCERDAGPPAPARRPSAAEMRRVPLRC
jgi:hypothetical protein